MRLLTTNKLSGITYDMRKKQRDPWATDMHGVVSRVTDQAIVFPIDIIEAAAPELALGVVADKADWLKGWSSRFKLFEVPFRHQTARPWRDDEMQLVCDIDLGTGA
jgi:hypothetical protein